MEFYKTILRQLGGNKFTAMAGVKHLGYDDEKMTLSFKIGRNCKRVTHVSIRLTSMDLYDMDFITIRKNKMTKREVKGVYNNQLQSIFTQYTGLDTHL